MGAPHTECLQLQAGGSGLGSLWGTCKAVSPAGNPKISAPLFLVGVQGLQTRVGLNHLPGDAINQLPKTDGAG